MHEHPCNSLVVYIHTQVYTTVAYCQHSLQEVTTHVPVDTRIVCLAVKGSPVAIDITTISKTEGRLRIYLNIQASDQASMQTTC